MQSAWRFVDDEALRERLREAKGIGTPATRAEIIRGLKAQDFLTLDGKHVVPTERGLALFGILEQADPALVDPGVTAQLELLLDEVLVGRQEMLGAIDAVCAQALRSIGRLTEGARAHAVPLIGAVATAAGATGDGARSRGRRKQSGKAGPAARKGSARKASAKRSRTGVESIARASGATEAGTTLRIPFGNKQAAQQLGARYRAGSWYAPPGVELDPFRQRGWL
jgi:DNA topoisomerase-3